MEMNRLKGAINTAPIKHQNFPKAFNRYFLSIPKNIIDGIGSKTNQISNTTKNPNYYLSTYFITPFLALSFKYINQRN